MGERLVCIQKVAGSTPVGSTITREVKMAKDLEDELTEAIMELLLDAKEQGLGIISFEDVCKMMGVDDMSLLSKYEQNLAFDLNTEYSEKMKDPDVRQAMIESFKATKH